MRDKQGIIDILIGTGERGGVENVINLLGVELVKRGYRIRVIQLVWEEYEWVDKRIEFHAIFKGRGDYNLKTLVEGYISTLNKYGIPDLIIAANWPLMTLIAKECAVNMNLKCKILSWLHNPLQEYIKAGYGGIECLSLADAHLAINSHIAKDIEGNIKNAKLYKVKNAVDFKRSSLNIVDDKNREKSKLLLYVGRIDYVKRIDILLNALAKTRYDWSIRIVGEGPSKKELENLVKQIGIEDKVQWIGWTDNPWKYAYDAAFAVMASDYEGFPLTAIEANSCGLPVISTPVDGITELIEPGVNGYIVPFNDSNSYGQVLDYISDGALPMLKAKDCIEAVKGYKIEEAVKKFEEVIIDNINLET